MQFCTETSQNACSKIPLLSESTNRNRDVDVVDLVVLQNWGKQLDVTTSLNVVILISNCSEKERKSGVSECGDLLLLRSTRCKLNTSV